MKVATYLQYDISQTKKRAITKLRLRSNRLEVISGRYTRPITPLINRICKICKTGIDDEQHFFTQCPVLNELREKLYIEIKNVIPYFPTLSDEEKTILMLNPLSVEMAQIMGTFLTQSIKLRNI